MVGSGLSGLGDGPGIKIRTVIQLKRSKGKKPNKQNPKMEVEFSLYLQCIQTNIVEE